MALFPPVFGKWLLWCFPSMQKLISSHSHYQLQVSVTSFSLASFCKFPLMCTSSFDSSTLVSSTFRPLSRLRVCTRYSKNSSPFVEQNLTFGNLTVFPFSVATETLYDNLGTFCNLQVWLLPLTTTPRPTASTLYPSPITQFDIQWCLKILVLDKYTTIVAHVAASLIGSPVIACCAHRITSSAALALGGFFLMWPSFPQL